MRRPVSFYYGVFFLSGINTMLLSVVIPQLHPALPDASVGRILAAQFTGQLFGPFFVTRNARRSLMAGLLLSAVAAFALGLLSSGLVWVLPAYGLGLGLTMTATNILVGEEAQTGERAPRIEMLNAFWPLGAACAPVFLRVAGFADPMRIYLFVAGNCLLVLPLLWIMRPERREVSAGGERQEASVVHLVRLCLLAMLAVGLESALSNWSPTFAMRYVRSATAAGTVATVFWVGILAGRSAASFVLRRVRWKPFAVGSAAVSVVASLAFAASHGVLVYAAVFVAALGVAPIYPAIIARCIHVRGKNLVFVAAGVGSAAMPWVIGTLSLHNGSLRISLLAATVAAILLVVMLLQERAADAA